MNLVLLKNNFENEFPIDTYESLLWVERYNRYGDFELILPLNQENFEKVTSDKYILMDTSFTGMVVESVNTKSDGEEGEKMIVKGRSLESILDRRIVWPPIDLTGNFQLGIKKLIDDNIINPTQLSRKIDNFQFQLSDDPIFDLMTLDEQYEGDNLYSVISTLCQKRNIGFRIRFSTPNQLIFSLYRGTDRSSSQVVNPRVIFSPEFSNISKSSFLYNKTPYKTVAFVTGKSDVADQQSNIAVPLMKDGIVIGDTGLDRREMYVDATNIARVTQTGELTEEEFLSRLVQRGVDELMQYTIETEFEGEVASIENFVYQTDFFIGDIVQLANSHGQEESVLVDEIITSKDESGNRVYPTFVNYDPTKMLENPPETDPEWSDEDSIQNDSGVSGRGITLISPTGSKNYNLTGAGLTSALTDAVSGNVVLVPSGPVTGGPWFVPQGVVLAGWGEGYLKGLVVLSDQSVLQDIRIESSDPPFKMAVAGPLTGTAFIKDCLIKGSGACIINSEGYLYINDTKMENLDVNGTCIYYGSGTITITGGTIDQDLGFLSSAISTGVKWLLTGTGWSTPPSYIFPQAIRGSDGNPTITITEQQPTTYVEVHVNILPALKVTSFRFRGAGTGNMTYEANYYRNGVLLGTSGVVAYTPTTLIVSFNTGITEAIDKIVFKLNATIVGNESTSTINYLGVVMTDILNSAPPKIYGVSADWNVTHFVGFQPMSGDRSNYDVLNYPNLHANDRDQSAISYHHSLGTGQFQAAPGNHTHSGMHDPVTVVDTPTVNLTINGQQIQGDVISSGIKLDDLGTPDDNADLNATTLLHGLLPKLSGDPTTLLRGDGTWGPIWSHLHLGSDIMGAVAEATHAINADVAPWSGLTGVPTSFTPSLHALSHQNGNSDVLVLDTLGAPTDITALNATTLAHGLLPKLSGNATDVLRGDGSWAGVLPVTYINTDSTHAFEVEQLGVNDNTLVVDTTNNRIGMGAAPTTDVEITRNAASTAVVRLNNINAGSGVGSSLQLALGGIDVVGGGNVPRVAMQFTAPTGAGSEYFRINLQTSEGAIRSNVFTISRLGKIGINKVTATSQLDVVGNSYFTYATYPVITVERTDTVTNSFAAGAQFLHSTTADMIDGFGSRIGFSIEDSAGTQNLIGAIGVVRDGADSQGALYFQNNSGLTTRMVIDTAGQVGIGTTDPIGKFHIQATYGEAFYWEGRVSSSTPTTIRTGIRFAVITGIAAESSTPANASATLNTIARGASVTITTSTGQTVVVALNTSGNLTIAKGNGSANTNVVLWIVNNRT